jgi:hypothetical protein
MGKKELCTANCKPTRISKAVHLGENVDKRLPYLYIFEFTREKL